MRSRLTERQALGSIEISQQTRFKTAENRALWEKITFKSNVTAPALVCAVSCA